VMSDLGHGLSHTVGPDEVLARVAEAAGVAVRAQGAEVCVRTSSRPAVRATWGRPMAATTPGVRTERVAIVVDDDEVGEVLVLDPSGLPSDRALLGRIVELARPAVRNLVLLDELDALRATLDRQNAEIAASQTRLVRAAEEERRRLHDLVVSRLLPRIAALRTAVADAPATRRRDRSQGYAVLAAESSELARDVRAMAHDVLPPLLGDRGLVPALRSLVRDADRDVMLDTTGFTPADRLTSEVESALYLACRAALEHVSGDEGTTSVRLTHAGERVGFDVRGRGAAGPGELELAGDRVIALGGQVRVVEHADSRQVTGMLPIGGVQRAGGAAIPG
jgi:signal transduction histidine kinase